MIKMIATGCWGCAVALAGSYIGSAWKFDVTGSEKQAKPTALIKFKELNLPVVRDGSVAGYAVVQFSAVTDADALGKLEIKPDAFFADAIYKSLYARARNDPSQFATADWTEIGMNAKETVNKQYGVDVVQKVLLDEFGFVPAAAVRKDVSPQQRIRTPSGSH